MDERYLATEVYLTDEDDLHLEDLGVRASGIPDVSSECVIDLWSVSMFWRPTDDIGTVIQIGAGEPFRIMLQYPLFCAAFMAAANRRQYVMTLDQA